MNTGSHHYSNREFVRELKGLAGRNVLLLLLDGSAVFGRLGGIDDWVISVLPAVGLSGVNTVRFRPPNATLPEYDILLSEALIDICTITAVVEGPFLIPPISKACGLASNQMAVHKPMIKPKSTGTYVRQQCKLLEQLDEFGGQNIGALLVGGWVIGGQLSEVDECVILFGPGTSAAPLMICIGALNVFGPSFPGGILPLFGTFRAWVNLKTLTSVLIP
ncbi:MAG: hypothetical protein H6Q75_233 [Firmicutes bacterium]|nr:hypothetical protein [Bacillota bacterium]